MNPVSVAGVIYSPDRQSILMIERRDVPVWVLPGGGIDPGETSEEAVLREILEETGFTVKIDRVVGEYFPINRLARHTMLYECSITGGKAQLTNETRGIRFYQLDELPKLIPPPYPDWIKDAGLNEPPIQRMLKSVTYGSLVKNFFLHPILVIRFVLSRIGLTINS